MKETGRIIEVVEDKAKIMVKRNTACGNCGACQVGRENLEMIMTAENNVGAEVGDEVEIDIETTNFMTAVLIAYGIPLLGLILGIVAGYYGLKLIGIPDKTAQGLGALLGLMLTGLSYLLIRMKEDAIQKLKKFKPVVTGIVRRNA